MKHIATQPATKVKPTATERLPSNLQTTVSEESCIASLLESLDFTPHFVDETWWQNYHNILQYYFSADYTTCLDLISENIQNTEIMAARWPLYRLWIEILFLENTSATDSTSASLGLLADHLEAYENKPEAKALSKLASHYHNVTATETPHNEDTTYQLNGNCHLAPCGYDMELHVLNITPLTADKQHNKQHNKHVAYFDYCLLCTLICALYHHDRFHESQQLITYSQKLFPKSPLQLMWQTLTDLHNNLPALREARSLMKAYPSNPHICALYKTMLMNTASSEQQLNKEFYFALDVAQAAHEQDEHELFVSFLDKAYQIHMLLCAKDQPIPEITTRKLKSLSQVYQNQPWAFETPQQREKKAWLCYPNHTFFLSKNEHKELMITMNHQLQVGDWVYMTRKSWTDTHIIAIYEVKGYYRSLSQVRKNTLLKEMYTFADHGTNIQMEIIESGSKKNSDLHRRFGGELSFELSNAAHWEIFQEIKEQHFRKRLMPSSLQDMWKYLASAK
ncbi:MAG: hypothetical protein OXC44_07950 [Proteobacteria bacterium]|nr:hypothetical protein [Pseudomonadota bacterium]